MTIWEENFRSTIGGHDRLFILVTGFPTMVVVKGTLAKLAYEAGVKQVVDISAAQELFPAWRSNAIAERHRQSEEAIYNIPNRANYVTLRPSSFFTNHFFADVFSIRSTGVISSSLPADSKRAWISTTDIALLAVNVLMDPIERHEDAVYEMTSEMLSGNERAEILTRTLGKEVKFVEIEPTKEYENYKTYVHMSHVMAYSLVDYDSVGRVNRGLDILLRRKPETFEAWVTANKIRFA